MSPLNFGPPLGETQCKVCGNTIMYNIMDQMLECGLSGMASAPEMCESCGTEEHDLIAELGDKIQRDCVDCGWGNYPDDYEGTPIPGILPSGKVCRNCKGKGVTGTITSAKLRRMLIKRVKDKRRRK